MAITARNFFYHDKESSTYALKTASKMTIQNTAKATDDLIDTVIIG